MNHLSIDIPDEAATARLAGRLASLSRLGDTFLLEGSLGAGKTTFTRHFAWAFGVDPEEPITSPTFALVHEYEAGAPLLHADLYRLGSDAELFELGIHERLGRDVVALVEWGERFVESLAPVALLIRLAAPSADREEERVATLHSRGERGEALLKALSAEF